MIETLNLTLLTVLCSQAFDPSPPASNESTLIPPFPMALRLSASASVGRKSGSAFRHSPRHTPLHAGLSPQSGTGWNVLLHGQLARPSLRPVGDANSRTAGRCSAGAAPRTLPHRRLGRSSRPYVLPVDLTGRRCRLPRSLARDQDGIRESFARP